MKHPFTVLQEELNTCNRYIFQPLGLGITSPIWDKESLEYVACHFNIKGKKILFRKAKITPTKTGQFVTLWKRIEEGPIAPFSEKDKVHLALIIVQQEEHRGHFVFTVSVLMNKEIFTTANKEGKRGFRVYPPWDKPTSKQAIRTQAWQLDYFIAYGEGIKIDNKKVKERYELS